MSKAKSKPVIYVPVNLSNGTRQFCPVYPEHLVTFGIIKGLVRELTKVREEILHTEQQDCCFLSEIERAEIMSLARFKPKMHLSFNQCYRWELMHKVFRELLQIDKTFGSGAFDQLDDEEPDQLPQ